MTAETSPENVGVTIDDGLTIHAQRHESGLIRRRITTDNTLFAATH